LSGRQEDDHIRHRTTLVACLSFMTKAAKDRIGVDGDGCVRAVVLVVILTLAVTLIFSGLPFPLNRCGVRLQRRAKPCDIDGQCGLNTIN
jgi:hypothetical protein